jgi:hypothetical protein
MRTTPTNASTGPRHGQRGQSMVEYAVICSVLAAALFVPLPGQQEAAGAFRDFYNDLTYFISLP